jgi:hypothetical protein
VNVPQGDIINTPKLIGVYATDPAGNTYAITAISAAAQAVVTTGVNPHGLIIGQRVTITGVVGLAPMPGLGSVVTTATVVAVPSATTFTVNFNSTGGTYTSGGTVNGNLIPGQVAVLQGWNGTVSANTAASPYPTVTIAPVAGSNAIVGIILGGNSPQPGVPGAIPFGATAQICVAGICKAYTDTATANNNPAVLSAAHPGAGKNAALALGTNLGAWLSTIGAPAPESLGDLLVKLS